MEVLTMPQIYLRHTQATELDQVMKIIHDAQKQLLRENINQWQDGQPSVEQVKQDIQNNISYVLISHQQIAGTAALLKEPEPTYQEIIDGCWLDNNSPYATIHRFALADDFKGHSLSSILISCLLTVGYQLNFANFRIDTHPDNQRMQHLIQKNGFTYQGKIRLNDPQHSFRLAYELNL